MTKGFIAGDQFEEAFVGTRSVRDGITAAAGGGQASATPLLAQLNRVTVVASANDSVKLPSCAGGLNLGVEITVVNAAAVNSMNVFPASGGTEQIDSLGANAAKAVAAGKTATFTALASGQWHAMLSA